MKIKADITLVSNKRVPSLRAYANITLDDTFVVKGLKVLESEKGLFISMPQEKGKVKNPKTKEYEDGFVDRFFPITKNARAELTELIMKEYNKALTKEKEESHEDEYEPEQ